MTLRLGVVADDYTGASDVANALSANGLRTAQTIGLPPDDLTLSDIDAVVVALKSRSIAPERAVAVSLAAEAWLRRRGAAHVVFKICSTFDSTSRGNIGPVMDALRSSAGVGTVLVTPAFPQTGRTVFQGHLFIGAVPLNESPLKDHPLNPMHDASLVRVLAAQSAHAVGLLPFAVVEQGLAAVRGSIAAAGQGALIADAITANHLDVLGEAALDMPLSVGASGLAAGIARALARGGLGARSIPVPNEPGHAAILAGSCSAMTLRQIDVAAGHMPVLRLDMDRLLAEPDAVVDEAAGWARARLADGPVLIASSTDSATVRRLQQRHGDLETGQRVEAALASLAGHLLAVGVRRLVVAGGETSGAVVDRLGLQAFLIGDEIAPGVPVLSTLGTRHPGLRVALKSGNFGDERFFEKALAALSSV